MWYIRKGNIEVRTDFFFAKHVGMIIPPLRLKSKSPGECKSKYFSLRSFDAADCAVLHSTRALKPCWIVAHKCTPCSNTWRPNLARPLR
jgi:hypothetical protein